ncbi:unnamed protein product [Ixodes hexagonus]
MDATPGSPMGPKLQKPLVYNRLLPYADHITDEAASLLAEIKANLARAVMLREVKPSAVAWTGHLNNYIKLYGYQFSKEDHIQLIQFLLELIVIPDLELNAVQKIAHTLGLLMKKRELLSRDDLSVEWRPLYELYERLLYSPYEHLGMLLLPSNLETNLKQLVRCCRTYFSEASTQEMLDEWVPLMCPFDVTMHKAMAYLELFLPTVLPPEQHHKGFKLWFDKFIELWQNSHNSPIWENNLVWLFARLAQNNVGYIDWEPYIPTMFTRLLRSLNLPAASGKVQVNRHSNSYDSTAIVNWIVALLGGKSSCQTYVSSLFKAVESFYHPSNNGRWVMKLQRLLYKLPAELVRRLHRERYRAPSWETPVPPWQRLSDEDVTEFVECVRPVVLLSMFGKGGSSGAAMALQNLALLRPELVIPPVIERLYSALETLTEPHRLTAAMHCVVAVARSLVLGGSYFPEGPSHVMPLLSSCLPGIDPNDIKKCIVTFQFISTFATLIPLVDCSKAVSIRTDMTELEQEVCLATAEFEDFVLQLMGRCFSLIENSSLENPTRLDRDTDKMNTEENILEVGLASTFSSILAQCSPDIFQAGAALSKLHSFVSTRILETRVSGRYVAHMCRCMARVNPSVALGTFVPHFSKLVLTLTESDDVATEELLDDELLFSLLLLSEVVRCNGRELLVHVEQLRKVLHRTLHLSSRKGYLLASTLLRNMLRACTMVFPLDYRSTHLPWEKCLDFASYLPIRDWGRAGDLENLGIQWHLPSPEELACAKELLDEFLHPELTALLRWSEGERPLTREEVQRSLNTVLDCILGAGLVLPMWPGEPINLVGTSVPIQLNYKVVLGAPSICLGAGENVRFTIAKVLRKVLEHTLQTHEDDIKSLCLIVKIYHELVFYWGIPKDDFDTRWKGFHVIKKGLENRLTRHKQHIRALLVDRTQLQHEMRVLCRHLTWFTEMHRDIMKDLFDLSTSHYSEASGKGLGSHCTVRTQAQEALGKCVHSFQGSHHVLMKSVVHMLMARDGVTHEQLKGALYVALGKKQRHFLTVGDWEALSQLWPALVGARHSEKPSIIWLLEHILESLQKYLETMQVTLKVPDSCVQTARRVWEGPEPRPSLTQPTDQEVAEGLLAEERRNDHYLRVYEDLVCNLVSQVESGTLHWRHYHMALVMVKLLIRSDIPLPTAAVRMLVHHLVHDTINMRKASVNLALGCIYNELGNSLGYSELMFVTCFSLYTQCHFSPLLINRLKNLPKKKDSNIFNFFNSSVGVNSRPRSQVVFGLRTLVRSVCTRLLDCGRARVDRNVKFPEILNGRKENVFDFFQAFSGKIVRSVTFSAPIFSAHSKQGGSSVLPLQGLFRNFGSAFLPVFEKVLAPRIADTQESNQRCALEMLAGIMRGSKHWGFTKMQELRRVIEPILKTGLNSILPETLPDWGTCVATISESRDPNKYHWFFEQLMADPLKGEDGSFLQASRLYVLLGGLAQQEWRVCELLHQQLEYLKPRLMHSYQNVRDKMGSLLCNIFLYDLQLPMFGSTLSLAPRRSAFVDFLMPQLAPLCEGVTELLEKRESEGDTANAMAAGAEPRNSVVAANNHRQGRDGQVSPERKRAALLLQTVSKWILASVSQSPNAAPPEIFQVVPVLCQMQSDNTDEELQRDCAVTLALLGNALLPRESIQAALDIVKEVMSSALWHSRAAGCNFLQFLVFSNLFTMQSCEQWRDAVVGHTLSLLKDPRLEVRETAAETLGGLLHCEFLKVTDELLLQRPQRRRRELNPAVRLARLRNLLRGATSYASHVLQLPFVCTDVAKYDVTVGSMSEFMSEFAEVWLYYHFFPYCTNDGTLLCDLRSRSCSASAQQHQFESRLCLLQTTIKKTLSNFRRTHHDTWRDHKVMFTDDQLAVITDLLVSPSYYA